MKAMIFAAGLGTRLRPLTDNMPKALVPISGIPLLEITIRRLKRYGFREIIVNIHHFGEQIVDFLAQKDHFGIDITISDERDQLLDTGGGLKKAAWFLQDAPFLLLNADVVTNLDLGAFYQAHLSSGSMATLAILQRSSSRYLLFDDNKQLSGWRNDKTGERRLSRLPGGKKPEDWAFSGIHAISPSFFDYLSPTESVFSIIDTYLDASAQETITGYPHPDDIWLDVGKAPQLEKAAAILDQIELD
jgi:NDP-sugar pyrophosphorylase family protein